MKTSRLVLLSVVLLAVLTGAAWAQGAALGPKMVTSSPVAGSTVNVPVATITITFDQVVATPQVQVLRDNTPVAGTTASGAKANEVIWTPSSAPLTDGFYTVDLSALHGANGMPIQAPTSFTFLQDTTRPTLLSSVPAAGQSNVDVAPTITLNFSEPLGQTPAVTLTGPTGAIALALSSMTANSYSFTPTSTLSYGTTYAVDYSSAVDMAGNAAQQPAGFSFTTIPPPAFTLVSSLPADGQTGVPAIQPISLRFSNSVNMQTSTVIVRSPTELVNGTLSLAETSLVFTPTAPLRLSTEYTVLLTGVRDVFGQAPTGTTQITFRTENGGLTGYADPQMISLSAGERVGVTYLVQNTGSAPVTLSSSVAEFLVNGLVVGTVNVPAELTIPGNSVGTLASDASISQTIQDAARAAGTDQVVMVRTFRHSATGDAAVNIPLNIRIGSSLAGAATVNEIVLDVPPDGKTVSQSEEIRAHAFIRGTGTGAVVGTWFVDDRPVETFQINLTAGITQEVSTRMTLPTLELGPHAVELRVIRPEPVSSGTKTYLVVQPTGSSQRVFLVLPRAEAPLLPDAVRTTFRWAPMPGAAAYEIAFAPDLAALGLDPDGKPIWGPLGKQVWTDDLVRSGRLSLLVKVPADVVAWTPSADQYASLFAGPEGTRYWALRAVYPAQPHGDPSTTSQARSVLLLPKPAGLVLVSPAAGSAVDPAEATFTWQPAQTEVNYELTILSEGRPVYRALTRNTSYTISRLSSFRLAAGDYAWQVTAMTPDKGIAATSEQRTFKVVPGAPNVGANTSAPIILAAGFVVPLVGAAGEIAIKPADGATVSSAQPVIEATYPEAKPGQVMITLNGVDVTELAAITPTSLTLQPPGVFSEGQHTVVVTVETTGGQVVTATSRFAVTLAGLPPATTTQPESEHIKRPLQMDLNWNWRNDNNTSGFDGLTVDLNLKGQQSWAGKNGSYAALNFQVARPGGDKVDLSNFLAEGALQKGRYKAMAGDIGSSESELTAQGLMYRAFSFVSNSGPLRLTASHTLGRSIQRSSIGRAPDMLLFTAESAKSTPESGLKLTYVDSENDLDTTSSFAGKTKSKALSLSGRTPLGRTGLKLRAELANSDSTVVSAFGSSGQNGTGLNATVEGIAWGCGISANYRRTGNDYFSAASNTLTNDIKGWTFGLNRPLGRFVSATTTYSTLDNAGGSSPASSLTSKALDLTFARPQWPALSVKVARNDASSDPFVSTSRPGDTRENVISATASYANPLWNGYVSYSRSDFDDFFDFIDTTVDTPNDRTNNTWSLGFGMQPLKVLRVRLDWGTNDLDRWFRPLFASLPVVGTDRSDQFRAQAEYTINQRLSSSLVLTNSDYTDALGIYKNKMRQASFRLNYLIKLTQVGGGFILTGEWRRSDFGGNVAGSNGSELAILVNDNAVLSF